MKKIIALSILFLISGVSFCQNNPFEKINFLIGDWQGTGTGFGNEKSKIESGFKYIMKGKYIEVINDSKFEPTESSPEGENHIDKGIISYDNSRKTIVYRQFNIEGYVNQYVLNDFLSNDSLLIFETEVIENFMPGGKARWTIKRVNENQIETKFYVYFPEKDYTCFGTNVLIKE